MWILFSFLTAVFEATKDGLCKKSLAEADVLTVAWAWKALSLPFLLPALFWSDFSSSLSPTYWTALAVGGGLNILATVMYIQAIKLSDLSVTLPMLSFTPVFLLGTSPALVGDVPGPSGAAGVLLIVFGAYFLHAREARTGFLEPVRALVREKGARLMLGVAMIWSIAANMDKIGVQETSPFFWSFTVQAFISAGLTLIIIWKGVNLSSIYVNGKPWTAFTLLALIGLTSALGLLCQMQAVLIGLVPYVIAIKRTSILFGVLFGGIFFRERDFGTRLTGAAIMLCGVFLITLL